VADSSVANNGGGVAGNCACRSASILTNGGPADPSVSFEPSGVT
jgi:hypothetical protein